MRPSRRSCREYRPERVPDNTRPGSGGSSGPLEQNVFVGEQARHPAGVQEQHVLVLADPTIAGQFLQYPLLYLITFAHGLQNLPKKLQLCNFIRVAKSSQ